MVFFESDGSSDFASVFASVAEERKEEEERRQTELFLQVLDELEAGEDSETGIGLKRNSRNKKGRVEHMRVSILDDESNDTKKKSNKVRDKKVHTIDDLPKDDLFDVFGPPMPETPEISIEAGRRLHDGKVVYNASIPGLIDGLQLGTFSFSIELAVLAMVAVFLFGLWIGRRASARRARAKKAIIRSPAPRVIYAPYPTMYRPPPPPPYQSTVPQYTTHVAK